MSTVADWCSAANLGGRALTLWAPRSKSRQRSYRCIETEPERSNVPSSRWASAVLDLPRETRARAPHTQPNSLCYQSGLESLSVCTRCCSTPVALHALTLQKCYFHADPFAQKLFLPGKKTQKQISLAENLSGRTASLPAAKHRSSGGSASPASTFRTLPCPNSQSGPI